MLPDHTPESKCKGEGHIHESPWEKIINEGFNLITALAYVFHMKNRFCRFQQKYNYLSSLYKRTCQRQFPDHNITKIHHKKIFYKNFCADPRTEFPEPKAELGLS